MKKLSSQNKRVLLVVAVVIIGGGIWLATKGGGTSVSINKELQSKCLTQVNDDLFCKFAGAFGNAGDYRVTVNTTDGTSTSVLELSSDSKSNSSMVVRTNGQEQGSVVLYNGVTYVKDSSDGQWFKYGASDTNKPEVLDLKKEFVKGDFKSDNGEKIDYIKIGTEKCGDLTCYKYQVKEPAKADQEGFLWFDTKNYLLRRVTIKQGSSNTDMSVNYTSVSISEPSPTKDFPSVQQ